VRQGGCGLAWRRKLGWQCRCRRAGGSGNAGVHARVWDKVSPAVELAGAAQKGREKCSIYGLCFAGVEQPLLLITCFKPGLTGLQLGRDYRPVARVLAAGEDWEASVPKGSSCPAAQASGADTPASALDAAEPAVSPPETATAGPAAADGEAGPAQGAAAAAAASLGGLSAAEVMARGRQIFEELGQQGKEPSEMW
jgi:hypothetical protein